MKIKLLTAIIAISFLSTTNATLGSSNPEPEVDQPESLSDFRIPAKAWSAYNLLKIRELEEIKEEKKKVLIETDLEIKRILKERNGLASQKISPALSLCSDLIMSAKNAPDGSEMQAKLTNEYIKISSQYELYEKIREELKTIMYCTIEKQHCTAFQIEAIQKIIDSRN